jgi:hypothetical protein
MGKGRKHIKSKTDQHIIYLQYGTGELLKELSVMKRDNGGLEAFPLRGRG